MRIQLTIPKEFGKKSAPAGHFGASLSAPTSRSIIISGYSEGHGCSRHDTAARYGTQRGVGRHWAGATR